MTTDHDTDPQTDPAPPQDVLRMARNLAAGVDRIARYVEDGGPDAELQAHVRGLGPRQHAIAELAAHMALVSLAEDVHRIAAVAEYHEYGEAGPAPATTAAAPDLPGGSWPDAVQALYNDFAEADSSNDIAQLLDDWFTEHGFGTVLYREGKR